MKTAIFLPCAITEAMNHTCDSLDTTPEPFLRKTAKRLLKKERW